MRAVFADAQYWCALLNRRDEHHDVAKKLEASLEPGTQLITTQMVLVELLNIFAKRNLGRLKVKAAEFVSLLRDRPDTQVIPQTSGQFADALDIYRHYEDKLWGHTDCASYKTMKDNGITDALTFDEHFEQMGFRALFRTTEH